MEASHIRELQEAYQNVYYTEETFFSDLVDIFNEYLFESREESNDFLNALLEQDLLQEFIVDFSEDLEVDVTYYLDEARGGRALGSALKGLVSALKGGKPTTRAATRAAAVGSTPVGRVATAPIRAAARATAAPTRAAAPSTPASAPEYKQGLLFSRSGKPQNFTGGRTPFTASDPILRGRNTPLPKPSSKPSSSAQGQLEIPGLASTPKVKSTQPAPGPIKKKVMGDPWNWFPAKPGKQLGIPKEGPSSRLPNRTLPPAGGTSPRLALPPAGGTSSSRGGDLVTTTSTTRTPRNTSYRGIGGGQKYDVTGQSFRATGPGGSARTQRLASQSAPPSNLGSTTSSLKASDRRSNLGLYAATGAAGVGVGAGGGIVDNQKEEERRRKEEEKRRKESMTSESYEYLEILANVLVNEGYVKDYDGAVNMINSLDENGLNTLTSRILKND